VGVQQPVTPSRAIVQWIPERGFEQMLDGVVVSRFTPFALPILARVILQERGIEFSAVKLACPAALLAVARHGVHSSRCGAAPAPRPRGMRRGREARPSGSDPTACQPQLYTSPNRRVKAPKPPVSGIGRTLVERDGLERQPLRCKNAVRRWAFDGVSTRPLGRALGQKRSAAKVGECRAQRQSMPKRPQGLPSA
jgi:hypothetical protein